MSAERRTEALIWIHALSAVDQYSPILKLTEEERGFDLNHKVAAPNAR